MTGYEETHIENVKNRIDSFILNVTELNLEQLTEHCEGFDLIQGLLFAMEDYKNENL